MSVFSVWASFGPGTQPELGQNQSKGAAKRWARQILLSGISPLRTVLKAEFMQTRRKCFKNFNRDV